MQSTPGPTAPVVLQQFDGANGEDTLGLFGFWSLPSPSGAVGPDHYFQQINFVFRIFDKSGTSLVGPLPSYSFWSGLPGPCGIDAGSGHEVRYDAAAGRWFASMEAQDFNDGSNHYCIAISTTADPAGSYFQYAFPLPSRTVSARVGVWPEAYYVTLNQIDPDTSASRGIGIYAFDRAAMLLGDPATYIYADAGETQPDTLWGLPADLDGLDPPPPGAPNVTVALGAGFIDGSPEDLLHVWQFHADFADPGSSTFEGPIDVPIAPFDPLDCGLVFLGDGCAAQLDSPQLLFAIPSVLMHRLAYRNFGTHESLVANFTVDADGTERPAVRWFELRDPNGAPAIEQEGTYAPDSSARFIGSIAMDVAGNMALGYSKSDATIHPAAAVTGRLTAEPAGTMGTENTFFEGPGSVGPFFGHWGQISSMAVDSTDGCTFWFSAEYYGNTLFVPNENSRVASFRFPSCTGAPAGRLEGTVTDSGGQPLVGAMVSAAGQQASTDTAGFYQFQELDAGTYAVTASKFGYLPGLAADVEVTDGGTTTQNFALELAPTNLLLGVVKDGSGAQWPLYARVGIATPGFAGATVFSDPVTGFYSASLVAGSIYTVSVETVLPGYVPATASLLLPPPSGSAPTGVVRNFDLLVDSALCIAPGYRPVNEGFFESFDGATLPPDWSIVNNSQDGGQPWSIFDGPDPCGFFPGNATGGSGPYALVNSNCDGEVTDDTELISSLIDLSGTPNAAVSFRQDFNAVDYPAISEVDISTNDGASWTNVLTQTESVHGPALTVVDVSALAGGQSQVRVRFRYNGFFSWWWQVDDVSLGFSGCLPFPGGLVVGNVRDANSNNGINAAAVSSLSGGGSTQTFPTPEDPNQDDGLYVLFSDGGPQTFEASAALHGPQAQAATVVPTGAVRLDFLLPSGLLTATPRPLFARIDPGTSGDRTLTLSNSGAFAASFTLIELDEAAPPVAPGGPFADPALLAQALARIPERWPQSHSVRGLPPLPGRPTLARPLAAGDVLSTFPSGLAATYGIAFNLFANDFWLTNDAIFGGDNYAYRFLTDGTNTGDTIDNNFWVSLFVNDGTFNARTGMLWFASGGGFVPCIFELDPVARIFTGNFICPKDGIGEDGLAYDPVSNTYYGATLNGSLHHYDGAGVVLDSAFIGLAVSGLAYNPSTGHLFALTSHAAGDGSDVYVLDVANGYAIVGSFDITSGGAPALGDFGQGGMEIDCSGNLWLVDFSTGAVFQAESGETGVCDIYDIPWLSADPQSGVVGPASAGNGGGNPFAVTMTFDSTGLTAGLRQAQLLVTTDTPSPVAPIPVNFIVRFLDVPDDNFAESFIYGAAGAGIMPGCDADAFLFCPQGVVTRADMAGYIERGIHGADFVPPTYSGIFGDVAPGDYNADYIQGLFDDGITAGCGGGNYCPGNPNTRAQMSVFIEKAIHGPDFVPPPCTGIFADVPCSNPFAVWIEALYNDGITAGCGGGNFCPNSSITNAQMAVFVVRAFQVPHI